MSKKNVHIFKNYPRQRHKISNIKKITQKALEKSFMRAI